MSFRFPLGTASPEPLRISGSLAMPVFSLKSFVLCDEGCMKLALISVVEQASKPDVDDGVLRSALERKGQVISGKRCVHAGVL